MGTTSHQPSGNLTDQQGHDLGVRLAGLGGISARLLAALATSLAYSRSELVDPH